MLPSVSNVSCNELQRKRIAMLAQKWQDCTASSYYKFNRIALLSIGLWPYQTSISRQILITFFSIIIASGLVIQCTVFITTKYSVDLLLQILSYSIPWLLFMLKYNIHCLNIKKSEVILEQIQHDWNILSDAREIEIIKKYSTLGRFITLFALVFTYVGIFIFILMQLSTFLLDIIMSKNESHIWQFPALTEYFVDQQKYFFPIFLHMNLCIICGLTTMLAAETFNMSLIQHACGLFQIASWHIKHAFHKDLVRDVASIAEKNTTICRRIIYGINMHKRAIKFIEMTAANYKWAYLLFLPLGLLSLSVNLYRLSQLIPLKNYRDIIYNITFTFGHFWYMFFCNYIGQELIDHSGDVFHKIYNAQWYIAPLKAQKLLLLMMQRSMRHCTFVVAGLFIPSLEGTATLTSMAISYFMVIYSTN